MWKGDATRIFTRDQKRPQVNGYPHFTWVR
eukprot:SAG22_NODE_9634_length_578_cov_1.066806_2_plen_29_part_01